MAQQITARKQQELQNQYTNYKNGLQQIASKIGDVETEAEEHKLVLETLEPLPGDRKCFRMINGVLVERTVKDVVPALKTNSEGLRKVLEDLVKQYNSKQSEMEKWKVRKLQSLGLMESSADEYCYTEEEQYPGRAAVIASAFVTYLGVWALHQQQRWVKSSLAHKAVNKEARTCQAILLHNGEVNTTYAAKHSCPRSRLVRIILTELPRML
ncbi:Cochaperone prefoldin complex subunit [Ciborinia camelliae]|nr:Cochaperone prefoldin complex subunit [Ciborinia camelliae]